MSVHRHFRLTLMFISILALSACETPRKPNSNWWDVGGAAPQTTPTPTPAPVPAGPPTFDPIASPRSGAEIPPWDPTQPTVQQPDAQVKAEEWMQQYDVRGGIRAARVGLLVPLTGRASEVGQSIMNAAQLALFEFAGPNFELLPYDTKSTPEGAVQAARFAISDGVSLIIGPLLSNSAKSITPLLQANNLNALAFTNDSTAANQNVFVLGIRPEEEVRRIIQYAVAQGSQRFAFLAPADEYGIRVRTAFEQAVLENGAELSKIVQFLPSTDDIPTVVKRLANYDQRRKALLDQVAQLERRNDPVSRQALKRLELLQTIGDVDFDTLLVATGGKTLQTIAANIPYYDIDPKKVRILGTSLWDAKWVRAEPALIGGWFAAPSAQARADFESLYSATYSKAPHRLATLAYDAVALSAVLSNEEGIADYTRTTLTDPSGFLGRTGIFRLRQDGLTDRGLSIMQVQQKLFREASPAPQSFTSLTN